MSGSDHWHYSSDIHGGAEEHHRHYDLERDLERAQQQIRDLWQDVRDMREHIAALEKQTPAAVQAQRELDETLADNAAAGYGPDQDW